MLSFVFGLLLINLIAANSAPKCNLFRGSIESPTLEYAYYVHTPFFPEVQRYQEITRFKLLLTDLRLPFRRFNTSAPLSYKQFLANNQSAFDHYLPIYSNFDRQPCDSYRLYRLAFTLGYTFDDLTNILVDLREPVTFPAKICTTINGCIVTVAPDVFDFCGIKPYSSEFC